VVVYSLVSSRFLILAGRRTIVRIYTQEENALGNSPDSQSNIPTTTSERRKAPRYTLVATTVLTDITNSTKLSGRVTEISRSGCYVDILYPLPVGAQLIVNISCDRGTLVVKAKILYIHERIGMGLIFLDPPKDQLEILDSWLAELSPAATP
jgi:hypothetical protein